MIMGVQRLDARDVYRTDTGEAEDTGEDHGG